MFYPKLFNDDIFDDFFDFPRFRMPAEAEHKLYGKHAAGLMKTDIRDKDGVDTIFASLDQLWALGCDYQILFMEADLPTIVNRYKESRRPHPLQAEAGSLEAAVRLESKRLDRLRTNADFVINTTGLTLGMLQAEIYKRFMGNEAERKLNVTVISFGFKYGIPIEADMVLDARFLPNPYYVEDLRSKTGLDPEVSDYVFGHDSSKEFMQHLNRLFAFLLPQYVEEGKTGLTVAVGCTGGRHRSVAVASALCETVRTLGHSAELVNRDIDK